jgi:hypothetical protein
MAKSFPLRFSRSHSHHALSIAAATHPVHLRSVQDGATFELVPDDKRVCTDIFCLIIFCLFIVLMLFIAGDS